MSSNTKTDISAINEALFRAVQAGNSTELQRLITAGADVNKADAYGSAPAHYATRDGYNNCLRLLIAAGADINAAKSNSCYTPALIAALNGQDNCLQTLIVAGADLNKAALNGWFPAHFAACGHDDCLRLLIAAGVDLATTNKDEETAGEVAQRFGKSGCAEIIRAAELVRDESIALASVTAGPSLRPRTPARSL